jgi:hypothetical protein
MNAERKVTTVYSVLKAKYPDKREVKYSFYSKFFGENISIRFGRHHVGSYVTCEMLRNKLVSDTCAVTAKQTARAR